MAPVPEQIGPYRVIRPIETGATAEVYEVRDPSGERLALKLLLAVKTALARFNREYEVASRLNHPNLVRTHAYGLHLGSPWITTELLHGPSAQAYVKRIGRTGSDERAHHVLRIGHRVGLALQYLHERRVVHRDVQSANVVVLPDERVKLGSLGAATLLDGERITADGELVGTLACASPEQIAGRPVDHRSDLYALGVLLFQLATGVRPFEADDLEALGRAHRTEPPPDPRSLVPNLSDGFAQLILALLEKDPSARPPSAEAVSARLEELRGRPFSARSPLAIHRPVAIDRAEEHRALWTRLDEQPTIALVLVDGEDGSDRGRFLDEVKDEAARRGWAALSCAPQRESLRRLVEALVQLGAALDPSEARPLVEAVARAEAAVAGGSERAALTSAVAALIRRRWAQTATPVLLAFHDLHRADPPTLDLLGGLRRALADEPARFTIVVSVRPIDLENPAEPAAGPRPRSGGRSDLARRFGDGFRIGLAPLDPREVAIAVGEMVGRRPPPSSLAQKLHQVTSGQPLFVEQAVGELVAQGRLEADADRLAWADQPIDPNPPAQAAASAEAVLATQPVVARRVLEALAIGDDASDPAVLVRALGWAAPELGEVLERLVADGILRWRSEPGGRPEWRSVVLRQRVARAIHPCRRALLARLVADAARSRPPTRGGVEAMVAAGRIAEAARAAVALAREAVPRGRVRTALAVLGAVAERVGDGDRSPELAELFVLYAHCLRALAPTDPLYGKAITRARALASEAHDAVLTTRVAVSQARLAASLGQLRSWRDGMRAAWDARPGNVPTLAAEIATEIAAGYRLAGDLAKADHWVEEAQIHADLAADPILQQAVAVEAASCALSRGRLVEAERIAAGALALAERTGNPVGRALALARLATVLRHEARYSEALGRLQAVLPEAWASEDPRPYLELLLAAAWIELDLARLGRAQAWADEIAANLSRTEEVRLRLEAQLLVGRIQLASGRPRSAAYVLQEVQRGARQADLPMLAEQARALHAEAAVASGEVDGAQAAMRSAVAGLVGAGDQLALAEVVRGRARVGTDRDPDEIFRPVQRLVDEQPLPVVRLEQLLAKGAWLQSRREEEPARGCLQEAATLLSKLATDLDDTDRAALRVHPWSTSIRRGLQR